MERGDDPGTLIRGAGAGSPVGAQPDKFYLDAVDAMVRSAAQTQGAAWSIQCSHGCGRDRILAFARALGISLMSLEGSPGGRGGTALVEILTPPTPVGLVLGAAARCHRVVLLTDGLRPLDRLRVAAALRSMGMHRRGRTVVRPLWHAAVDRLAQRWLPPRLAIPLVGQHARRPFLRGPFGSLGRFVVEQYERAA